MTRYTKEYIAKLLDKYMDGTSTLEEEDVLAEYFRGQDIPQEWADYQQLFQEMEAMKPVAKPKYHRLRWAAIAAVIAGVIYMAIPSPQTELPQTKALVAQADSTTTITVAPDTTIQQEVQPQPVQTKKRRLRKPKPTMTDIDKTYALMAEAAKGQQEAEEQITQCRQELTEARLLSLGYIPVEQEDGTILYINEQTKYLAYEE